MERFTVKSLIERIKLDKNINIIAFLLTPWAVHGLEAYLMYLRDRGVCPCGFVVAVPHPQAGRLLDESSFHFDETENIHVIEVVDTPKYSGDMLKWIVSKQVEREIYLISQGGSIVKWHFLIQGALGDTKVKSVIIDEGIGMYMRTRSDWIQEMLVNTPSYYLRIRYLLHLLIIQPLSIWCIQMRDGIFYFSLFQKVNRELRPNSDAIPYYAESISKAGISFSSTELSNYAGAVVINTQPFEEYHQVLEDEDLRVFRKICAQCTKVGLRVVLKPHPREKNILRYQCLENCWIDTNKERTQESILLNLETPPCCIIGYTSTTLVTCSLFANIPTASLVKCSDVSKFIGNAKLDFAAFSRTFSGVLSFPDDIEEFLKMFTKSG